MKKYRNIICIFFVFIALVSCGNNQFDNSRYIEDYDYLWASLEESYPYFGVLERSGIDWSKTKDEYREKILKKELTDTEFYSLVNDMLKEFRGNGHLNVINRDFYHMARYVYSDVGMSEWVDILSSEKSEAYYYYDENLFNAEEVYSNSNIEFYTIEEESIAYISIKSFRYENVDGEREVLFEIYEEIEDYEHIIFDITENGGGSAMYFSRNIIEPLINEPLYFEQYILYSENESNKRFMDQAIGYNTMLNESEISQRTSEVMSINELLEFEMINESDLASLNKVIKLSTEYMPDGNFSFEGKIWLLVGNRVYSASDAFAQVCKKTGFATLVGLPTGGDGVGFDPILVSLPETGIVVRFSTHYGLNLNGQNNEEYGTSPDILIEYGDSAYDKVLKLIRKESQ